MQFTKDELLSVIVMDFAKQKIGQTCFTEGEVVEFVQKLLETAKRDQRVEFMLTLTLSQILIEYMTGKTEQQVKDDFVSAQLKRDLIINHFQHNQGGN